MKSVAIFFLFLSLSTLALLPLALNISTALDNDSDQLVAIWSLLLMGEKLLFSPAHLYEAPVHYPHGDALRTGYCAYIPAIIYYSVFLLVRQPIATYNILYIGSIAMNGFCMYAFVYYLTGRRFPGFVAGMVYALCPMRFGSWGFVAQQSTYWMPLSFLFLAKFFDAESVRGERRRYIYFVLGLFFYLLQFLSDMTTGLFFALAFFPFIFFEMGRRWRGLRVTTAAAVVFGVVVLCGMIVLAVSPYLRLSRERGEGGLSRRFDEIEQQAADIASYVNPPPSSILYGGVFRKISRYFPDQATPAHFPGIAAYALAVCGIVTVLPRGRRVVIRIGGRGYTLFPLFKVRFCRDSLVWFFFFLWLASILFTLGPEVRVLGRGICAGPYIFIYKIFPPIRTIRAIYWMGIVALFSVSVLAGYGAEVLTRNAIKKKTLLAVCIVVVLLAELMAYPPTTYGWPYIHMDREVPEVYRWLDRQGDDSPIIELPMPWEPDEVEAGSYGLDSEYAYWTLFHNRKTVNCYVGSPWPEYKVIVDQMKLFPSRETIDILRFLGVRYVILHTDKGPRFSWQREIMRRHPEADYEWADTIRRIKDFEDDIVLKAKFGPDYVYELGEGGVIPGAELEIGGARIPRAGWKVTSNQNAGDLSLLMDGIPDTAWVSSTNKRAGICMEVDLGSIYRITGFTVEMRGVNEYPKNLRVEVSIDGGTWREVDIGKPHLDLVKRLLRDHRDRLFKVSLPDVEARFLRITLTRWDNLHPWSVTELDVFGRKQG